MIIISHRGNLEGPNKETENDPGQIAHALSLGFHVEVDVHIKNGKWFLGHDEKLYPVDQLLFFNKKVWCHAKSIAALQELLILGAHCFWHQEDDLALTSKNFLWMHPRMLSKMTDRNTTKQMVLVHPQDSDMKLAERCYAICTDNPMRALRTQTPSFSVAIS